MNKEDQGQDTGGGVMTPKNVTIVDLSVTTSSVTMSVDTTVNEYVLIRSQVDNPNQSS